MVTRLLVLLMPCLAMGQVTLADYQRAEGLREKYQGLAVDVAGPATWIEGTPRFWYRKSVKGGHQFMLADAEEKTKRPAFDQEKLAASLGEASGTKQKALALPFTEIVFADQERSIEFAAEGSTWRCDLSEYACKRVGMSPPGGQAGRRPPEEESPREFENNVEDGIELEPPQQQGQRPPAAAAGQNQQLRQSPDGKWEALIRNYNVFVRAKGQAEAHLVSHDGSEGNYYTLGSMVWSPDSRHLVAYRVRPGYKREVHYVESSPVDQLQPKHTAREYAKPGDVLDVAQPVLFQTESKQQIEIDRALFPNPYSLSRAVWWKDSRGFTFEYNQRGHMLLRVVEVNGESGAGADHGGERNVCRLPSAGPESARHGQEGSP